MGWAIRSHQPSPIDSEPYRQPLHRHIMDNLVVGALQERGIDGGKWLAAFCRQPGRERHRMLLGDAHVKAPIWKPLGKFVQARAVGMAAVIATMVSSRSASAVRASAKIAVYCGVAGRGAIWAPVTKSNFPTP